MVEDELKNLHIVVYALSLLGGAHQKVHTEDLAQKCLEIAPDRFKWERYPYPDKELVRKALFHASENKNGGLVVGRAGMEQRRKSRDGWQLTPAGAAWLSEHESLLRTIVTSKTVNRLLTTAKLVSDQHILRFLELCELRFSNLLGSSRSRTG